MPATVSAGSGPALAASDHPSGLLRSSTVVGNHWRAARRRAALHDQPVFLDAAAASASDASMLASERLEALEALAGLPEDQRGALLLVTRDGQNVEATSPADRLMR